jgi:hypothetical protein
MKHLRLITVFAITLALMRGQMNADDAFILSTLVLVTFAV